ncbi:MmgE/PrpD family protein, partial [Chloroflexota bacterium]
LSEKRWAMSITGDVVRYIAESNYDQLPKAIVKLTKELVLDEIGCAFSGYRTKEAQLLVDYVKGMGSKPEATILGDGEKANCYHTAGVNAFMANMLDFDSSYQNMTHPASMIIWPAISMAEHQEVGGRDLINSIVTGYEVATRIYDATKPSPRFKQRYYSGNYATFGSAVVAAKILKLDEHRISQAIGIAGYTTPLVNISSWLSSNRPTPIKAAVYWQSRATSRLLKSTRKRNPLGKTDIREN